jgi:hypothetical protein
LIDFDAWNLIIQIETWKLADTLFLTVIVILWMGTLTVVGILMTVIRLTSIATDTIHCPIQKPDRP